MSEIVPSESGNRLERFTHAQRAGLDARQVDRDRTLGASHDLEAALASAAPGRQEAWRDAVLAALEDLDRATAEEQANGVQPDSLLSDISRTQPRLRTRVRGVRTQYRQLRDGVSELRRELGLPTGSDIDFTDVRQRVAWLLAALRHQRARESDLIYEAYYEAFKHDVEEGS